MADRMDGFPASARASGADETAARPAPTPARARRSATLPCRSMAALHPGHDVQLEDARRAARQETHRVRQIRSGTGRTGMSPAISFGDAAARASATSPMNTSVRCICSGLTSRSRPRFVRELDRSLLLRRDRGPRRVGELDGGEQTHVIWNFRFQISDWTWRPTRLTRPNLKSEILNPPSGFIISSRSMFIAACVDWNFTISRPPKNLNVRTRRSSAGGHRDRDRADRLLRRAAAGPGDSGDADADVAPGEHANRLPPWRARPVR